MKLPIDTYMQRFNSNIRRISIELGVSDQCIRRRYAREDVDIVVFIDDNFMMSGIEVIRREIFDRPKKVLRRLAD